MNEDLNPDVTPTTLWDELKRVVEKYERAEQPEVRKSANAFGKIIDTLVQDHAKGATSLNVTVMSAKDLLAKHTPTPTDAQSAPVVRDTEWAIDGLVAVVRDMLAITNDQGAQELLKAVGVVLAGALQAQQQGGTGHTLVVVEKEDGNVRVQAQKVASHAARRV